jgi:hypothetical protein
MEELRVSVDQFLIPGQSSVLITFRTSSQFVHKDVDNDSYVITLATPNSWDGRYVPEGAGGEYSSKQILRTP